MNIETLVFVYRHIGKQYTEKKWSLFSFHQSYKGNVAKKQIEALKLQFRIE